VRSSRRLEAECHRNIEVMWLLNRLSPDHKVIAEFRRLHRDAITRAGARLIQWARSQAMLQGGWVAIDGSKFRAVSSQKRVLAREALRRYLSGLDDADRPAVETAVMPDPEPEARLMRTAQEGNKPAYNVQTAVETQTGLIVAHEVTTEATDNRSLWPMVERVQGVLDSSELHVIADAGYSSGEQARRCEEAGIVTHIPANRAVNTQGDGTLFDRSAFAYHQFFQLRHDVEQIADHAIVSHGEDRSFFILVDGDDDLGVLHAGQVLDGAGNTDSDIQLRGHDLAGLTDLHVVRHETGVNGGAGSTDGGAQLVGQAVEDLEVVAIAHAAAAGNDDLGGRQFRTVGLGQLFAHKLRGTGIGGRGHGFDGSGATGGGNGVKAGGAHGDAP
jgi:hypothetical protein